MTKIINTIFIILVGCIAVGCGPSGPVEPDEVGALAQDAIAAKLDSYLANLNASGDFSGSVAVTIDGEMLLVKGYGLANEELGIAATLRTKYRIGSMTKQFTSMAILILQEQGVLKVEDSLGTHLSDVPAHWAGVTLHQLLTHTSGIMHSWNLSGFAETMMIPATLDETLVRFHDQPLLFAPSTKFAYSGVGYFVLAKVIETVSGRSYEDFLRTEIFSPLGMDDTGADTPDVILKDRASGYMLEGGVLKNAPIIYVPILTGGGNLYSTVEDLSEWERALTARRLISPESYDAMYRPELANYAYGWGVVDRNGRREFRHGGGVPGFKAHILRTPDEHLCVIVLSNVQHAAPEQIANQLADMVYDAP
jgi:CubicO group peptidase (beta-lactamase class C family)